MEGLIFGGAYLRREICVSKSIGLALYLEGNLPFLLCIRGQFPGISPPGGAYIRRGYLTEVFCVTSLGGLYLKGLIHEWTVANRLNKYFRTKPTGTNIACPKKCTICEFQCI